MKNYDTLKKESIKLRRQGLSYGEIKKKVNVSKSTLSFWLKDTNLTDKQKKRLYTKSVLILNRGPQSQKERRLREIARIIEESKKEVSNVISLETYRLFGAALYWSEGNKKNGLAITNSDPYLILFMVKWFEKIFKVTPKNLKARLNIYPQQNEADIKKFWSQLTSIPLENFGKTFVKPLNKNYKKNNLYYGTINVRVPKGTDMRHRIFGWIKTMMNSISEKIKLTQQEWKKLEGVSRAVNISK